MRKIKILVQSPQESGEMFASRIEGEMSKMEATRIDFTTASDGRQTANISYCERTATTREIQLEAILKELVKLKTHKDHHGEDAVYESRKNNAWNAAKEILNTK